MGRLGGLPGPWISICLSIGKACERGPHTSRDRLQLLRQRGSARSGPATPLTPPGPLPPRGLCTCCSHHLECSSPVSAQPTTSFRSPLNGSPPTPPHLTPNNPPVTRPCAWSLRSTRCCRTSLRSLPSHLPHPRHEIEAGFDPRSPLQPPRLEQGRARARCSGHDVQNEGSELGVGCQM